VTREEGRADATDAPPPPPSPPHPAAVVVVTCIYWISESIIPAPSFVSYPQRASRGRTERENEAESVEEHEEK